MIDTERDGDAVVLTLYGALGAASKSCFEQALARALSARCKRVVIDLGALEFIDWLGLQLLLKARDEVADNGSSLSLLRGPRNVQRLFELTGATRMFSFEN